MTKTYGHKAKKIERSSRIEIEWCNEVRWRWRGGWKRGGWRSTFSPRSVLLPSPPPSSSGAKSGKTFPHPAWNPESDYFPTTKLDHLRKTKQFIGQIWVISFPTLRTQIRHRRIVETMDETDGVRKEGREWQWSLGGWSDFSSGRRPAITKWP